MRDSSYGSRAIKLAIGTLEFDFSSLQYTFTLVLTVELPKSVPCRLLKTIVGYPPVTTLDFIYRGDTRTEVKLKYYPIYVSTRSSAGTSHPLRYISDFCALGAKRSAPLFHGARWGWVYFGGCGQ